jgi:hypothetical protein
MSTPQQPTEEELRAAYEQELKRLRVEDVVVQTLVSLVNLGGRKAGLAPGTEDERDPEQLQMAIDAALALLPLVERQLGPDAAQVRNALSQLQMAYAQMAGGGQEAPQEAPQPQQPPRQEPPQGPGGGRLWIPGQ